MTDNFGRKLLLWACGKCGRAWLDRPGFAGRPAGTWPDGAILGLGFFVNHLLVELPVDDLCLTLMNAWADHRRILHVVIGVLLLQQLHARHLSDAETVEALAFNMAWHYALDVRQHAEQPPAKRR